MLPGQCLTLLREVQGSDARIRNGTGGAAEQIRKLTAENKRLADQKAALERRNALGKQPVGADEAHKLREDNRWLAPLPMSSTCASAAASCAADGRRSALGLHVGCEPWALCEGGRSAGHAAHTRPAGASSSSARPARPGRRASSRGACRQLKEERQKLQAEMDKVTKVATLVGSRMARLVMDARRNANGNTQLTDELKRYNRRLEARRPPPAAAAAATETGSLVLCRQGPSALRQAPAPDACRLDLFSPLPRLLANPNSAPTLGGDGTLPAGADRKRPAVRHNPDHAEVGGHHRRAARLRGQLGHL